MRRLAWIMKYLARVAGDHDMTVATGYLADMRADRPVRQKRYCNLVINNRPISGVPMKVIRLLFVRFVPDTDKVTFCPGNGSRQLALASRKAFTGTVPT